MATWAKGLDFKNSTNTLRVGGVGVYGTDKQANKIYIGLGEEPWNNNGLEITESALTFKGNKVLIAGDTINPASIGALPLSGGTMTGTLRLKGAKITSSISSNRTAGREELQIYATGDAYMQGSRGAGMHLYGNNDIKHSGNIAFMTGDSDNGTARMIISQKGNTTLGNALWDFVDDGKDVALLNIKGKSGVPALLFHNVSKTDGEIAVPLNENLSFGHYDTTNNTFTSRLEIEGTGNVVSSGIIKTNKGLQVGNSGDKFNVSSAGAITNAGNLTCGGKVILGLDPNKKGGIGYDPSTKDVYIANTNNNWLRLRDDKTMTYAGSKVYTSYDKPKPSEIGAAESSHTHNNYLSLDGGTISGQLEIKGNLKASKYLQIEAWEGFGTGTLSLWFNNNDGAGELTSGDLKNIKLGENYVYHTGNKPNPSDIGAAKSNHDHDNYISGSGANGVTKIDNANDIWKSGFYDLYGGANAPFGNWVWLLNVAHSNNRPGYKYGFQIAAENGSNNFAMRTTNVDGVGSWNTLWHTGNFDPGRKATLGETVSFHSVHATSNGQGNNFAIGDDCWLGDVNEYATVKLQAQDGSGKGFLRFGNGGRIGYNGRTALEFYGESWFDSIITEGAITAPVLNITDPNGYRHSALKAGDNHVIGVTSGWIYLGNPHARTQIEGSSNPTVKIGNNTYTMYHTGNKPSPGEIGAMAEGGTYGTIYLTDWIRTIGNSGWYNQSYDGGWYMSDSTWIRSYNNKSVYTGGTIRADRSIIIGNGSKFSVSSSGTLNTTTEAHFSNGNYSDPLSGVACAIKASGNIATDNMYAQYYCFNTTSNYINGRTGGGYDFWFGNSGNRITFDGGNHKIYKVTSSGVWTVIAG